MSFEKLKIFFEKLRVFKLFIFLYKFSSLRIGMWLQVLGGHHIMSKAPSIRLSGIYAKFKIVMLIV